MTTICICGAGTMGSGIAQVAASAGYSTLLYELNGDVLKKAEERLGRDLQMLTDKGRITEEKRVATLAKIRFTSNIEDCRADLVIEAIVEKMEIKLNLFRQLAAINTEQTIFASNTSSLSISELAAGIPHPERVAGLHFFNPAPVMKLVEVVKGKQTSDDVVDQLVELTRALGKQPVRCTDAPGFIVNRVA